MESTITASSPGPCSASAVATGARLEQGDLLLVFD